MLTVIVVSIGSKYTMKERIFMSFAWIPKSTVPAALAGVIYSESKLRGPGYEDYMQYGLIIQTTTILSIIFCEPIGAFLVDTFAPKMLALNSKSDSSVDEVKHNQVANTSITTT